MVDWLFAVGLDGHLYHIWQTTKNNSSEWSELTPLGSGTLPSDPVVAQNDDGRLEVFAVLQMDNFTIYGRLHQMVNGVIRSH